MGQPTNQLLSHFTTFYCAIYCKLFFPEEAVIKLLACQRLDGENQVTERQIVEL
jgi:hypothetical protein